MKLFLIAFISAVMILNCSNNRHSGNPALLFSAKKIGELPCSFFGEQNKGVAGAFSGIVHNKLIVAGGSYFPDKKPWEGGIKIFEDKIYAFDLGKGTLKTIPLSAKLSEPVAYGASISLPNGILCIGGNGPVSCSSKVFMIKWNEKVTNIEMEEYPALPVPLSYTTAVLFDHTVYVAGGSASPDGKETNNYFFRLNLSESNGNGLKWERLPPYPGIARILSVMVAQSNGIHNCLYLFSGRNVSNPDKPVVLNDGLVYDPILQKWEEVQAESLFAFPVMAGSAFPTGTDKIVFVGGAPDSSFLREYHLKKELANAEPQQSTTSRDHLKADLLRFYNGHRGFSTQIFVYNTVNKSITPAGNFQPLCPVTTNAIPCGNGAIVACGEIKPGIRTPEIYKISKE
jgi:cyclically-permuted mutarotase family protein